MSSIQIEQNGHVRTIPLPAGETLLSVLRRAGYSIPAACGGKGRCGKCRVPVNGVPRLACRVYPADGDTVTLPETAGGTILTGTHRLRRRRRPRHDDRRRAAVRSCGRHRAANLQRLECAGPLWGRRHQPHPVYA